MDDAICIFQEDNERRINSTGILPGIMMLIFQIKGQRASGSYERSSLCSPPISHSPLHFNWQWKQSTGRCWRTLGRSSRHMCPVERWACYVHVSIQTLSWQMYLRKTGLREELRPFVSNSPTPGWKKSAISQRCSGTAAEQLCAQTLKSPRHMEWAASPFNPSTARQIGTWKGVATADWIARAGGDCRQLWEGITNPSGDFAPCCWWHFRWYGRMKVPPHYRAFLLLCPQGRAFLPLLSRWTSLARHKLFASG